MRMRGRAFVAAALAVAAVLAVLAGVVASGLGNGDEPATTARAGPPPNIVLILSDDQAMSSFRRDAMPSTFDLLVDRGANFENFIISDPNCCPSRATLLTGQYAHNTRVFSNSPGYGALRGKANVLPEWLRGAGYRTAHIGKFLNKYPFVVDDPRKPAPGWDRWMAALEPRGYYDYRLHVDGGVRRYGTKPRDYSTRVLTRYALRTVERWAPGDSPFFMQFAPYAPHVGYGGHSDRCNGAAVPDPRDVDLFEDEPFPAGAAFNEDDVSDKPSFIRRNDKLSDREVADIERKWRCELAAMRGVDRAVAQIHAAIADAGDLRDTVFIFLSDNGYFYGEHRIPRQKSQAYQPAVHVPMAIAGSRGYRSGPSVVEAPASNADIAPTILDIAGVEPCVSDGRCRTMDGRSLAPLLQGAGGDFPADRRLVIEYKNEKGKSRRRGLCSFSGLWTPSQVYVEYRESVARPAKTKKCEERREYELYDLADDPEQLENLLHDPDAPDGTRPDPELQPLLDEMRHCAGIEGRDPEPDGGVYCE